jgi:putative sigma-54 modulation protein
MKINIKSTNMELTDTISQYVHDKLESIDKLINDVVGAFAQVEVGKESNHHHKGDVFKAEINLRADGVTHYAVIVKDNLYSAIDELRDEISEKIKSKKDKDRSRFKKGALVIKNMVKGLWPWKQ